MWDKVDEEVKAFVFKIIVPALVAVSVKLAVMGKNEKITFFQVISSFVTGIGSAWLAGPFVQSHTSPSSMPLVIAAIAISGEKIGHFFIYKLKIEELARDIFNRYTK